jgi:redox-sensitive bicupin YhaK (pirin superfamily)
MKPFVFLDYFDIDPKRMPPIGFHPHSGIETVAVVLQGQLSYQETQGKDFRNARDSHHNGAEK